MARAITDLDVSDVSDTILSAYIRDGYDRFMALERRWPWLEASYTLNTVANQSAYLLSAIGDVREITAFLHDSSVGSRIEWRGRCRHRVDLRQLAGQPADLAHSLALDVWGYCRQAKRAGR